MAKATPTSRTASPLLTLLSVIALLIVPLPLHAQIEWTPEEQISLDDVYDDWFPEIAAGPDGRVWVVWQGSDGYDPEIMYSVNDGNGWSYPDRVNTDDYAEDSLPDIAVGLDGNPWVVWGKRVGGHSKLYWSRWEGDGWRPEERVFPDLGDEEPYAVARMAVGPDNAPWLVWTWPAAAGGKAVLCSRCEGDSWSPPETIVEFPLSPGYGITIDAQCHPWVVLPYQERCTYYSYREAGSWAPIDTIPGITSAIVIEPDSHGALWAAWREADKVGVVQYLDGTWSQPETVAEPGSALPSWVLECAIIDLAASQDGPLWASWICCGSAAVDYQLAVFSAFRTPTGWNSAGQVSGDNGLSGGAPRIAVAESGQAHVVWQGWDGRDFEIVTSRTIGADGAPAPSSLVTDGLVRWFPNPVGRDAFTLCTGPLLAIGSIDVYDISGRLVRHLSVSPGTREVGPGGRTIACWDCTDQLGRPVTPGTYIWKAFAGGQRREGVIVVIR